MASQDRHINVALAAYGMSGSVFHAPLLNDHAGFHLHSVWQRNRRDVLERYPEVIVVRAYQDILSNSDVELVVVNTPEPTHVALAQEALEAGKHVVVEKAFTPTTQEANMLIDLARKQGKVLSVFQNSRWHGDFLTIRKIVENKLLGKLVAFEAHYDRFRNYVEQNNWKEEKHPGTGVLYNLGSHMIDQALVLFGLPEAVQADLSIQRPGGNVVDNFELLMFYDSLKVTLKSSYLVREAGPRYVLHGTDGSFVKYGTDPQEARLKAGGSPREEDWGTEPKEQWGKINTQLGSLHVEGHVETIPGSYMGFYDNIYAAIRKGEGLEVKPKQAIQVISIIEAAYQSHREQRRIAIHAPP